MTTLADHLDGLAYPCVILMQDNGDEERIAVLAPSVLPFAPDRLEGEECAEEECDRSWHSGECVGLKDFRMRRIVAVTAGSDPQLWRESFAALPLAKES